MHSSYFCTLNFCTIKQFIYSRRNIFQELTKFIFSHRCKLWREIFSKTLHRCKLWWEIFSKKLREICGSPGFLWSVFLLGLLFSTFYFLFVTKTYSQITKEPYGFKMQISNLVFSGVREPTDKFLCFYDLSCKTKTTLQVSVGFSLWGLLTRRWIG